MIRIKKNGGFIIFAVMWLSSSLSFALQSDFHLWPTLISVANPEETGVLFSWPEYQVILKTKNESGYSNATVNSAMADYLTKQFTPAEDSPIEIYRDVASSTWGLTIPGGPILREENRELLAAMAEKFITCLSTLSLAELYALDAVITTPLNYLSGAGGEGLNPSHHEAAATLLKNFEKNRCATTANVAAINKTLRTGVNDFLAAFLTGKGNSLYTLPGTQRVLASLFKDFLFSSKGLWVRVTLAHIQDFVEKQMANAPFLETSFVERDYDSFVDFVLLTKDTTKLTLAHYLAIAQAMQVNTVADAFKLFPLMRAFTSDRFRVVNMQIGSRKATFFVGGGSE